MPLNSSSSMKLERKSEAKLARCHGAPSVPDVEGRLHPQPHDHQPDQRDRDEDLPAQTHDLVVAVAREGGADQRNIVTTTKVLRPSTSQIQGSMKARMPERRQPAAEEHETRQPSRETIMLAYSARKNIANDMPEYSIMWPATISIRPRPRRTDGGWSRQTRDEVDDEDRQQRQPVPGQEIQAHVCGELARPARRRRFRFCQADTISTTTSAKPIAIS